MHLTDILTPPSADILLENIGCRTPVSLIQKSGVPIHLSGKHLVAAAACFDLEPVQEIAFTRQGSAPIIDPRLLAGLDNPEILVRAGWTMIVYGFQIYSLPLIRLFHTLCKALDSPVSINAYYTPPQASGLPTHSDRHDVLVWQQEGRKRWKVFKPTDKNGTMQPAIETVLEAGHMLYIPAGTPHVATNEGDDMSLHLTMGFWPENDQKSGKTANRESGRSPMDAFDITSNKVLFNLETLTPNSRLSKKQRASIHLVDNQAILEFENGATLKFRRNYYESLSEIMSCGDFGISNLTPDPDKFQRLILVLLGLGILDVEPA